MSKTKLKNKKNTVVKKAKASVAAKKAPAPAKKVAAKASPKAVKAVKKVKISKAPAPKSVKKKQVSQVPPSKDIRPKSPVKITHEEPAELIIKKTSYKDGYLNKQKAKLLELRDTLLDQIHDTAQNSVREATIESAGLGMHQGDAGSDTYDRDFALTVLSQEQDALYEIEEAIKRVEDKTYGVCQMSGKTIPQARLDAIPFTRFTVECQAQLERDNRGRKRWSTETPFAEMMGRGDDDGEDNYEKED